MRKAAALWGALLGGAALAADEAKLWWERGAATWYYKDDWRGLELRGGRGFRTTIETPGGAAGGWIVLWGTNGYALSVNGTAVASSVDGCLIDDFDLGPHLAGAPARVTLRIDGQAVCAEGEIVDRLSPFVPILRAWATKSGWGASRREGGQE